MADLRSSAVRIAHPFPSGRRTSGVPVVKAVTHIRGMRGGSQAHLMKCSDGHFYIIKFANNPQGTTILANEILAHGIASILGLPVPPCAIVDVAPKLIELTPELAIEEPMRRAPCQPGLAFGSRYVGQEGDGYLSTPWDILPMEFLSSVNNLKDFRGMLVFDKWTCNTDGRQVVFRKKLNRFDAYMIDNGFCFNAEAWTFPDAPLRALYGNKAVYCGAANIKCYERWLTRIEVGWNPAEMRALADQIPPEWYQSDRQNLDHLLDTLDRRRGRVRQLLVEALPVIADRFPGFTAPSPSAREGLHLEAGA